MAFSCTGASSAGTSTPGKGNKTGVPVKASLFHQKPTLNFLEQKFNQNIPLKSEFKKRIKIAIDWTLHGKTHNLASLEKGLQKEAIQLVIRRNEEGMVYGMTYVDYKKKSFLTAVTWVKNIVRKV